MTHLRPADGLDLNQKVKILTHPALVK